MGNACQLHEVQPNLEANLAAVTLTAALAAAAGGGGARRALAVGLCFGLPTSLTGLALAAGPVAWALDAATLSLERGLTVSWSDVGAQAVAASVSVALLAWWCA